MRTYTIRYGEYARNSLDKPKEDTVEAQDSVVNGDWIEFTSDGVVIRRERAAYVESVDSVDGPEDPLPAI